MLCLYLITILGANPQAYKRLVTKFNIYRKPHGHLRKKTLSTHYSHLFDERRITVKYFFHFWGMDRNKVESTAGCFRFVAYYRVSTGKQEKSGLGIEAQRAAVRAFVPEGGQVIAELEEVASGRSTNRPKLDEALNLCREHGACLVIAKVDRLARDVEYLFRIMKSGVKVMACDLPEFNTLTLGIFAAFAQYEAERISDRTKKALKAKKARGESWKRGKQGFTEGERARSAAIRRENREADPEHKRALAYIMLLRKDGLGWHVIAEKCAEAGFVSRKGKPLHPDQTRRIVKYEWERMLREAPTEPIQAIEDTFALKYGLDPTNKFKPAIIAREVVVPHMRKL